MEAKKNKKLLIIGGSGFIGGHLADRSLSLGYKVDIISLNKKKNKNANKKIKFINLDLGNLNQVKKLNKLDYDYVVNLGGYIDHSNYSSKGNIIIDTHFNSIRIIIQKLLNTKIKRFIQIGSSDEYGFNKSPQSEIMREDPVSPYSFAKTATTHFLKMLHKTENFPCVILRFFLVYGPRQNIDRLLPQVIKGCIEDKKFKTSEGNQLRDFCHVDDIIIAILSTFDKDKINGKIINIGSGQPTKIKTVIKLIKKIINKGNPVYGSFKSKKIENKSLYPKITLAKKLLGWSPKIKLEDGLKNTIKHYEDVRE